MNDTKPAPTPFDWAKLNADIRRTGELLRLAMRTPSEIRRDEWRRKAGL